MADNLNNQAAEVKEPEVKEPEVKEPKKNKKKAEERVELFIPRGGEKEDPNVQICINGVMYLLPKGKKSMVPPAVKAEYERSERARDSFYGTKTEMLEMAGKPTTLSR